MKLFAKVFVAAVLNLDLAEQQNPKKLFAKVSLKEIVKESLIKFKYWSLILKIPFIFSDKLGCQTGNPLGGDYKGKANLTVSGRSCQKWSMQDPHRHKFTERFVEEGDHNFCRNPDGEPGAWCYTTDADKRWEQCIIPECATPTKGKVDFHNRHLRSPS